MAQKIGIGWQVGGTTGWGVYGNALMMQSVRRGLLPIPVYVSQRHNPGPFEQRLLAPLQKHWFIEQQLFSLGDAKAEYPFFMGLGNDLAPADPIAHIGGHPEIGVVFFEHYNIAAADIARAKDRYAHVIAGSSWNAEVLQAHGFDNVTFCPQGIDATRFHPAPRTGYLEDKFVVFSGGKLEFRKGQDIVIEAFRRFQATHPDAVLVFAWHNHWDQSVDSIRLSPHQLGRPVREADDRPWRMTEWLQGLGLPAGSVLDLGEVAHDQMPQLLRECDIGVFPNRSEGGTNLVAMECMACGVPAILSDNTGHRDLLPNDDVALRLASQAEVRGGPRDPDGLFRDWGESDPDEIVAHLEWAYANREQARDIGRKGAEFLAGWAWPRMIDRLLGAVDLI